MELNLNLIQHLDVESLLTVFVENFFSSVRGGNTDTPMMLDFCLRFPSYYLKPTLGHVDINFCDLAKLPKPLSGYLSKK